MATGLVFVGVAALIFYRHNLYRAVDVTGVALVGGAACVIQNL